MIELKIAGVVICIIGVGINIIQSNYMTARWAFTAAIWAAA